MKKYTLILAALLAACASEESKVDGSTVSSSSVTSSSSSGTGGATSSSSSSEASSSSSGGSSNCTPSSCSLDDTTKTCTCDGNCAGNNLFTTCTQQYNKWHIMVEECGCYVLNHTTGVFKLVGSCQADVPDPDQPQAAACAFSGCCSEYLP